MKTKKALFIVSVIVFASVFGNTHLVSAQGCKTSCNDNTLFGCGLLCGGCGCYYTREHANPMGDDGVCVVKGTGAIKQCDPIAAIYDSSCSDSNMQCKESNCNGLSGSNGAECLVTMGTHTNVPMFACAGFAKSTGAIWDAFDTKCIICDNVAHKEQNSCGDSAGLYLNKVTQVCEGLSDGQFESACGADASCDEKFAGAACSPPVGGSCDANGICKVVPLLCVEDTCDLSTQTICDGAGNWVATNYCAKCLHCGDGVQNCGEVCDINDLGACGVGAVCDSDCNGCTAATGSCEAEVQQNTSGDESAISSTFHTTFGMNFNMGFLDPTSDHYVTSYADGEKLVAYAEVKSPPDCVGCKAIICVYKPSGALQGSELLNAGMSGSETKNSPTSGIWTYVLVFRKDGINPSCKNTCNVADTDCCLTKVTVAATPPAAVVACTASPGCLAVAPLSNSSIVAGTCAIAGESCYQCDAGFGWDGISDCTAAAVPLCDILGAACVAGSCCAGLSCDVGVTDKCIAAAGPAVVAACDPDAWFFCNPLRGNVETLAEGGERIIGYILGLIGSIALLLIIISGAMYMTSAGSEEKIANSKRILTGAVIGLGIALLAYSLLAVIMKVLGV